MSSKFDCHLFGPFLHSRSGVGQVTRAYWRLLMGAGLKVGILPQNEPFTAEDKELQLRYRDFIVAEPHPKLNFYRSNAQEITILQRWTESPAWKDAKNILIPMWETANVPIQWQEDVRKFSAILGATEFISSAFRNLGIDGPVKTIAPNIRAERDRIYLMKDHGLRDDRKIFLFSFAYASWTTRKNPKAFYELMKFRAEASPTKKELFVLAASDTPKKAEDIELEKFFLEAPSSSFKYLPAGRNREQQLSLIAGSNVFISPHRSEGIGMQLIEAILSGVPVVSHSYSGPADFLDKNLPGNFPYNLIEIGEGEYPNSEGQMWADFKVADMAKALQSVEDSGNISPLTDRVREHFSITANATKLHAFLSELGN